MRNGLRDSQSLELRKAVEQPHQTSHIPQGVAAQVPERRRVPEERRHFNARALNEPPRVECRTHDSMRMCCDTGVYPFLSEISNLEEVHKQRND